MPVLSAPALPALRIPARVLRRVLWNLLPATLVVAVLADAMSGEDGLLRRHLLRQRLVSMQTELAGLEASNAALRSEVEALRSDPDAVRRAAAEELLLAPAGSTVYRFGAD